MAARRKARQLRSTAPSSIPAAPPARTLWTLGIVAALIALDLFVYAQVGHQGFSLLDDPLYVSFNSNVSAGLTWASFKWAWTTFHSANWHPITWLSHLVDAEFFGRDPGPQHLTNLAIHVGNTVILFVGLNRMTRATGASALVAAVFGVHPMNVESVAWLAERKNVLSTFFWWTAIWAYVRYVRRPGFQRYALVAVLVALGLMTKPMLVTLPLVLLLIDVWPLGRAAWPWRSTPPAAAGMTWPNLIWEKLPLAGLAAASAVITFVAQRRGGAVVELGDITLAQRLANAPVACMRYLEHAVWPSTLSVFYPYPAAIERSALLVAIIMLTGISIAAWRLADRRPFVLAGWLWYLVTLIPVIGIVQVGRQAMADRYSYVPVVGILVAAVFGLRSIALPPLVARARMAAGIAIVLLFAVAGRVQAGYWDSTERLLRHAIEVNPENGTALHGLAGVVAREGRRDEAVELFRRAFAVRPDNVNFRADLADALRSRGLALAEDGRFTEAVTDFREALRLDPATVATRVYLGLALVGEERPAEALVEFDTAIRADPSNADARLRSASAYMRLRRFDDAVQAYRAAIRLQPNLDDAHTGLGVALAAAGHSSEAKQALKQALRINPANEAARQALAELARRIR
jgi:tetratricopeptide (TPR) repeat protein